MRDGEWTGGGRTVSADEVDAMEGVVGMLGTGLLDKADEMEE